MQMDSFYVIPKEVPHQLVKHTLVCGSVLVPYDTDGTLTQQLKAHKLQVTTNTNQANLVDPIWWTSEKSKKYDWVVCATMGLGNCAEYVLEYGMQTGTKGIAILDRLSFLEPVSKRRTFLLKYKLSDMVVLSPRPKYRATGSTRDSVTSCWFVFQRPENWMDGTYIHYAVNWDRLDTDSLPPLP